MKALLLFFIYACVCSYSVLGQDFRLERAIPRDSPFTSSGLNACYTNHDGTFILAGKSGIGAYVLNDTAYYAKLTLVGPGSIRNGNDVDQGFMYKDTDSELRLFFSTIMRNVSQGQRYWLYYSADGGQFTRWITKQGTAKFNVSPASTQLVTQAATTNVLSGAGGPSDIANAPDGKFAALPWMGTESVNDGSAEVTVLPEGIVKIKLKGRHSGFSGRTRFSCTVVASGYRNGEEYVVLNKPETVTLTVGANQLQQTASKDQVFIQNASFNPAEAKNIRNVRILLAKDKAGDNFVDVIIGMLQSGGQIFDEAEALYKKVKKSELGTDVATVAAGTS